MRVFHEPRRTSRSGWIVAGSGSREGYPCECEAVEHRHGDRRCAGFAWLTRRELSVLEVVVCDACRGEAVRGGVVLG